jgi:serine/threonine-protein kinase
VENVAWIVMTLLVISSPFQVIMYFTGEFSLPQMQQNLLGALLVVGCSAFVVGASRSKRISDTAVVWIGLGFEVLFCLSVAYGTNAVMYQRTGQPWFMTWVTPMILLYPLVVPVGPRVVIWVGLASAATEPISLLLLAANDGLVLEPNHIAILINPVLAVGVAWFGARMIHRLNLDLRHARQIGSYQLVETLGEGGMDVVWKAKHALLARPAAIKLVHAGVLGDSANASIFSRRLEQEAQATADLCSLHTIQLYDFGRSDDGAFFIVMGLLDGLDLQCLVERFRPQPPARVVYLLR